MGTNKGIVLGLCMLAMAVAARVAAEPSYLLYPGSYAVFHYDANRYETVTAGSPKFDAGFAIGGVMLWDRAEQRVPVEIYRAPFLFGFEPSISGMNEFVTFSNDLEVIVDGFGDSPRTLGKISMRFWPEPKWSEVQVWIDGVRLDALTAPLGAIEVTTPIPGGFYADTETYRVSWTGAPTLEIIAYSDKDADGAFDGRPLYRIVARDSAVPVESVTWGAIKALYRD